MNHFAHLRTQVKRSLVAEAKMSPEERAMHQWQFFATIGGSTYVVGKGGANTMFYMVDNSERKICYPDDMLDIISSWDKQKFISYVICRTPKKILAKASTEEEALKNKAALTKKPGLLVCGVTKENKLIRLHVTKKGLNGVSWVKYMEN